MKTRTEVCCEVRDALWALEASHDAQIEAASAYIARLEQAKGEMGLTGTMGAATLARAKEHLATLKQSRVELTESHEEAFTLLRSLRVPNVSIGNKILNEAHQAERLRA
jgi:hypothetical protein